ncbi:FAD:protein FMN transferase [Aquirufa nivalisilvae]|uniref:FAD:protein FMN transferase n=1 Tax=Aquirufa nivalisilvae TaxID=2516557 RepID=UPI0022A9B97A|nr:FAD:protein FMN transferase [Aquirufa nivalisilvae]MCZ2478982.1 FAD:protein FMN transferase [Aquirufa nivalisilvae]MCZ2483351.1 FAD:protein FMN transferase [Aquirufa nivalisilvae]
MNKKSLLVTAFVICCSFLTQAQWTKYRFETARMGSPFRIIVSTQDSIGLSNTIKKAQTLAENLEMQLSDYQPISDLSQVNQRAGTGQFYPIQEPFKAILKESLLAYQYSHGNLTIFIGKLVAAWRNARKTKELPASHLLQDWVKALQSPCLEFNADSSAIRLTNSVCQLDVGSIGKGFVAQRVLDFLVKSGYPYALVDAGGKISASQVNPQGDVWKVGLELPNSKKISTDFLEIKNQSIASSGKTYQQVEIAGKSYSHVINPKTGLGLEHARSATAIAPDGAQADWIATAATIMEIEDIKIMLQRFPRVQVLVWEYQNGELEILLNHGILKVD